MRPIKKNLIFKLFVSMMPVVLAISWGAARWLRPAQAQGITQGQQLPLSTAYFYCPLSVSENHMVKMCSNNLFGDGLVRANMAFIKAADGSVLLSRELFLVPRAGDCLEFRPTESLDLYGLLWSAGHNWGSSDWNSSRASAPPASIQLIDPATNNLIAIINTPGKVTVDTALLPDTRR